MSRFPHDGALSARGVFAAGFRNVVKVFLQRARGLASRIQAYHGRACGIAGANFVREKSPADLFRRAL
jgi:hypothetical protein